MKQLASITKVVDGVGSEQWAVTFGNLVQDLFENKTRDWEVQGRSGPRHGECLKA